MSANWSQPNCRHAPFFSSFFWGFQVESAHCVDLLFAKFLCTAENFGGLDKFKSLSCWSCRLTYQSYKIKMNVIQNWEFISYERNFTKGKGLQMHIIVACKQFHLLQLVLLWRCLIWKCLNLTSEILISNDGRPSKEWRPNTLISCIGVTLRDVHHEKYFWQKILIRDHLIQCSNLELILWSFVTIFVMACKKKSLNAEVFEDGSISAIQVQILW